MKAFYKKVSIYLSLLLLSITIVFFLFVLIEQIPEERNLYDFAFLGHSHVALALNPDILNKSGKKICVKGIHGQSLFWTVKSAEKLIKKNKVKYLFLVYTNNSLTTDSWTYIDDKIMKSGNLYHLSFDDMKYLMDKNFFGILKYILSLPLPFGNVLGGFSPSQDQLITKELNNNGKRIKEQFKRLNTYSNLKGYRTLYDFCLNNPQQKIVLLRMPLSQSFFQILGDKANETLFIKSIRELTMLPNVNWVDYANYIGDETNFLNVDHLNQKGSNKISFELLNKLPNYQ